MFFVCGRRSNRQSLAKAKRWSNEKTVGRGRGDTSSVQSLQWSVSRSLAWDHALSLFPLYVSHGKRLLYFFSLSSQRSKEAKKKEIKIKKNAWSQVTRSLSHCFLLWPLNLSPTKHKRKIHKQKQTNKQSKTKYLEWTCPQSSPASQVTVHTERTARSVPILCHLSPGAKFVIRKG